MDNSCRTKQKEPQTMNFGPHQLLVTLCTRATMNTSCFAQWPAEQASKHVLYRGKWVATDKVQLFTYSILNNNKQNRFIGKSEIMRIDSFVTCEDVNDFISQLVLPLFQNKSVLLIITSCTFNKPIPQLLLKNWISLEHLFPTKNVEITEMYMWGLF